MVPELMLVPGSHCSLNGPAFNAHQQMFGCALADKHNFFFLFAIFILHSRESNVSLCFGR